MNLSKNQINQNQIEPVSIVYRINEDVEVTKYPSFCGCCGRVLE